MPTQQLPQDFPNIGAPFVDELRSISAPWRYLLQALWARTGNAPGVTSESIAQTADDAEANSIAALAAAGNAVSTANGASATATAAQGTANSALALANTSLQEGDAVAGWASPTGTGSRATFDMDWTQAISNPPTQGEVQALVAQIIVLQKRLGQLELDLLTLGGIKP